MGPVAAGPHQRSGRWQSRPSRVRGDPRVLSRWLRRFRIAIAGVWSGGRAAAISRRTEIAPHRFITVHTDPRSAIAVEIRSERDDEWKKLSLVAARTAIDLLLLSTKPSSRNALNDHRRGAGS